MRGPGPAKTGAWRLTDKEEDSIPIDLETVTEARLVAQALAGSESAFEQIVRRYQRPVISLIARMTGDRMLAEDLAQETFVKAHRSLAAFDTTRRLSSWLFRIAHNTAIDALRRAQPPLVPLEVPTAAGRGPASEPEAPAAADPVEREALSQAIDAALTHLRPEYRAALTLRYHQELSFAEIAQIMRIPEATARSHVHRGRLELSDLLREAGWDPTRER